MPPVSTEFPEMRKRKTESGNPEGVKRPQAGVKRSETPEQATPKNRTPEGVKEEWEAGYRVSRFQCSSDCKSAATPPNIRRIGKLIFKIQHLFLIRQDIHLICIRNHWQTNDSRSGMAELRIPFFPHFF